MMSFRTNIKPVSLLLTLFLLAIYFAVSSHSSGSVFAFEQQDTETSAAAEIPEDVSLILDKILPDNELAEMSEYVSSKNFIEMFGYSDAKSFLRDALKGDVNLSIANIWNAFTGTIASSFGSLVALAIQVVVLGALCGLLENTHSEFLANSIQTSAFFVVYLALGAILIGAFYEAIKECTSTITAIISFMNLTIPLMLMLLVINGGFASSAALSPVLLFFSNLITQLIEGFIIPVSSFSFVLTFAENLLDGINISYMTSFIKKISLSILGVCFTVFTGFMTLGGMTFATLDSVGAKTVKYAASNLIPFVGGFLSDSYDTLSGFILVIKNSVGILGVLVILSIALIPAIKLFFVYLALRLSSIVVQPIADKRFSSLVDNAASSLLFIDMCLIIVGMMFIVMLACLMLIGGFMISVR